ncbi:MAG: hypothetical protein ACRDT8_00065 [Micromonosporaceae bacterium]
MALDLTYIRAHPDECVHEVTRGGELWPCEKPAVAVRLDHSEWGDGQPYPVCKHHTAGDCVPLSDLFGNDTEMLVELKRLRLARSSMERLREERNKLAAQLAAVEALPAHWRATIPGDLYDAATDLEKTLRGACDGNADPKDGTS